MPTMSGAQYQAMATAQKTAVGPGADIVDPGDVSRAKVIRDADQQVLALGMINAAAAVAGALASGTQKLTGAFFGGRLAAIRGSWSYGTCGPCGLGPNQCLARQRR